MPAPVHVGVPAAPPFAQSSFRNFNTVPTLNVFGVGPRMNKRQSESQMRTKRDADVDRRHIGSSGQVISDLSDPRTRRTHHHSLTSHQQPSSK